MKFQMETFYVSLFQLEDIPLYLYCIEKECINYVIPPNPGLLATIQKSHGIDLLNKVI